MHPDAISRARALADSSPAERDAYYASHQVPDALRSEVESMLRVEDRHASGAWQAPVRNRSWFATRGHRPIPGCPPHRARRHG